MKIGNQLHFLVIILFSVSFFTGCSNEGATVKGLQGKILKEKKQREEKAHTGTGITDEAARERYMAVVDACSGKHEACLSKCKNSACEDACQKDLINCEKELPEEFKTLK
jgi:hypothetical protein